MSTGTGFTEMNEATKKRPLETMENGSDKSHEDDISDIADVLEDIPQFVCVLCTKTFSLNTVKTISDHILDAHNDEMFCSVCKECFVKGSELVEHEKICTDERPFYKKMEFIECVFCKHLYRRDKLKNHVATEHRNNASEHNLAKRLRLNYKKMNQEVSSASPSILDLLAQGNKINLSKASLTIKEKMLGFSKRLGLVSETGIKTEMVDIPVAIKTEPSEPEAASISKPENPNISVKHELPVTREHKKTDADGSLTSKDSLKLLSTLQNTKINITGLKRKLQVSLKSD